MSARTVERIETALLTAVLLFAIWCAPVLPTHDGPNHVASCVLANRLEDPSSPLHGYLEIGAPLTNRGFQELCELFEPVFGWQIAVSLTLTVIVLAFAFAYRSLARRIDPESAVSSFGFVLALAWPFYMGFFEFVLGTGLSLAGFSWLLSRKTITRRDIFIIGLIALVIAAVHTFTAAVFGLGAFLYAMLLSDPKDRLVNAPLIALVGTPAVLLLMMTRPEGEVGAETAWHSFAERAADLVKYYAGGPLYRALPPALFSCACAVAAWIALAKKQGSPIQRMTGVLALILLTMFWASPFHLHGWAFVSPRPLLLGLGLAPLALCVQRPLLRHGARVAVLVMALIALGDSIAYHRRNEPFIAELLSGMNAPFKRSGIRLPLILEEDEPHFADSQGTVMLGHYYLFEQGGVDPYLYADAPKWDAILYRATVGELFGPHPVRFPRVITREDRYVSWAWMGLAYEDVILFSGDPKALETFLNMGYVVEFEDRRLRILRATDAARRQRADVPQP